jgi:hypothetical protein
MKRIVPLEVKVIILALACWGFVARDARAGLTGSAVNSVLTTQATGGWVSNSAIVGPGVEFQRSFSGPIWALTLDVSDAGFTLHYVNNFPDTGQGAANAGLLSFNLTGLSSVSNVSLVNSNFGNGLGSVTFDSTSLTVPITTVIPPGGTDWSATWNITFNAVPESNLGYLGGATWLMLLSAHSLVRRRRNG